MTHYPSNEEVEKEFGDQRLGWPDFCGNEDHQCECSVKEEAIKTFISQTRLSDLEAIIDGVEKIEVGVVIKKEHWNETRRGGSWELGYDDAVYDILSYLKSLKENKKVNAIIDKWGVRADMLSNN